ncbi:hypothetical protein EUBC25_11440 [Claveliimonas bilis]|uniref:hypothetical protein n=1 Tax=Claveliimonas bilis TaxID=3028070 RepID=UPI001E56DF91|nr:hypothetical protein [Claveliimonas bilis]BCZ27057.1 hypothetical protein EUBC25_11440 [Claveliimonas bilis]
MSKKKVCILSTVDFTRMTVVSVYTDYLKRCDIPFDIICVNKYGQEDPFGAENIYGFVPKTKSSWNKFRKLISFWKIRDFALDIFKNNHYDFIIVWNELTAFIFSDILASMFKDKYCINIRDYQYFNLFPVKMRLTSAIKSAFFTTVSSRAYLEYLPSDNCYMMYSFNKGILSKTNPHQALREVGKPIRILYIGQIAWLDNVYKLIDALKNDNRFEMIFAGSGSEQVEEYAKSNQVNNVTCYGRFHPGETAKYLAEADILYNLYGTDSRHLTTAVSIKFYYAVFLHIPILVYKKTEMEKMSQICGIGFAVENEEFINYGDKLYDWYFSLDQKEINKKCNLFLEEIEEGQKQIYRLMDRKVGT